MNRNGNEQEAVAKEIFIDCRRETLFSFLIDPQKMVRWMGRQVLLEPVEGGALRIRFNETDVVAGHYLEVKPHERVVFTWGWVGSDSCPPGSSIVVMDLQEDFMKDIMLTYETEDDFAARTDEARMERYWSEWRAFI